MAKAGQPRPDSYLTLTVLSINNACGTAALLLAPVVVGGLVTTLPFSSEQAGYVISVELAGFALAAIPAALWIRHFNWHWVLYVVVSAMLAGNLITSGLQTVPAFLLVRFLAGFGAGLSIRWRTHG